MITAHLKNGFISRNPWAPAIDGIVGAVIQRERLGDKEFCSPAPSDLKPVEGLPFERIEHEGLWWYAASSPIIVGAVGKERRYFHRRFDDHRERHLEHDKKVETTKGPYKAYRLYDVRVICRAIRWHAIGDRAEIDRCVSKISQVGGKRGSGFGEVLRWEITDDGDPRIARGHRPLPATLMERKGAVVMPYGLVPPARVHQVECVMPEERHDER
ncbi:hypothetical protein [Rhodovulum euryhalinum]|nr:hypothetical protein [Rhodovulum euryhalinum]